ncbi:MAG: hypothetical protein ABJB47_22595 [Actinomycetota bacterium]
MSVADVAALAGAGLRPRAGFATHPHWDHVLWSRELGDVPRYAAKDAVRAAVAERDRLVGGVRHEAPGHDLELFAQLVPLPDAGQIPRGTVRPLTLWSTTATRPGTARCSSPIPASCWPATCSPISRSRC